MEETTNTSEKSLHIILLVLAFGAGIAAAKFWYDMKAETTEVVEAPKEITVDAPDYEDFEDSEDFEEAEVLDTDIPETTSTEGTALPADEVAELIREAFIEKYEKAPAEQDEVEVTVEEVSEDGMYATGGVRLGAGPGNAGMFWAYKEDGKWVIAADGNGNPECAVLEAADFPEEMQEGCY